MNRFYALLAIASFASAGPAAAQTLELRERAHELSLGNVALPNSTAGTLIFKACETCDSQAVRVNSSTAYIAPEGAMALPDFIEYVNAVRQQPGGDETYVTVFRSTSDDRVTRVKLHARD